MNFLLSTFLFSLSILAMVAIARLVDNVVIYRTARQPVAIRVQQTGYKNRSR